MGKIIKSDSYYQSLIAKYNIYEPPLILSEENKADQYDDVCDVLNRIEDYENNLFTGDTEINELIEYSTAKIMQCKRRVSFDPYNNDLKRFSPPLQDQHISLGRLIKQSIPILKNNKICKHKKITRIKRLNNRIIKIMDLIQDENDINYIINGTKQCRI